MVQQSPMADQMPLALVSAVIARAGRVALVVRERERWRATPGCTFVPIELPGCALNPGTDVAEAISRLTGALLGQPGQVLPSAHLYGPSAIHAIDRLDPAMEAPPLPLLRLERGVASEDENENENENVDEAGIRRHAVRRVVVRAYRVMLSGEPQPNAAIVGILWATPRSLRAAMRGMPMGDLLAAPDVAWQPSGSAVLPEDTLAYVPGDYGERQLLRAVAKYGAEAVFQDDDDAPSAISRSSAY